MKKAFLKNLTLILILSITFLSSCKEDETEIEDEKEEITSSYAVSETILTVPEDTTILTFTVALTNELEKDVTVFYETNDQTAISSEDYESVSGEILFRAGELQKSFSINIIDDDLVEEVESFLLIVKDTSSVLITNSLATVINIASDDVDPATVSAGFIAEVNSDNFFIYAFTNTTVISGIDDITGTYVWDFGGDGTSTEVNPTYTFSSEGTYLVKLTATAADGTTAAASETISIAPKNKWARITDTSGEDTGELRYALTNQIEKGRMTFMYRVPQGAADGFINLSGSSSTNDLAIVEVRIKDEGSHEFREGASNLTVSSANFPDPKVDEWVPIEISWSANGTDAPTYSVVMDNQTVITDATSTTNGGDADVPGHLEATKFGAGIFMWKYNTNSAIADLYYDIDDILIYSSDSGSEVEVFSDDFQSYQTGTSLNPNLNAESVYFETSFEVEVVEED